MCQKRGETRGETNLLIVLRITDETVNDSTLMGSCGGGHDEEAAAHGVGIAPLIPFSGLRVGEKGGERR